MSDDEEPTLPDRVRERIREYARSKPETTEFKELPPEIRSEIREAEAELDAHLEEQQLYEQAEDELRTANADDLRDRPPNDSR